MLEVRGKTQFITQFEFIVLDKIMSWSLSCALRKPYVILTDFH